MSSSSPQNSAASFSRDFDLNIAADEAVFENEPVEKAGSYVADGFSGKFDIGGETVKGSGSREILSVSTGYGGLGTGNSERNIEGILGKNGGFRIRELGFCKNPKNDGCGTIGSDVVGGVVDVIDKIVRIEGGSLKRKGRGRPRKATAIMKTTSRIGGLDDKVVFDVDVTDVVGAVDGVVEAEGEPAKTPESIGRFAVEDVVYGGLRNGNGSNVSGNGIVQVEGEMVKKRGRGRPPKSTVPMVVFDVDLTDEIRSSVAGNVDGSVDGVAQLEGETSTKRSKRISFSLATTMTPESNGRFADEVVDCGDLNNEVGSPVVGNGVADVDDVAALVEEDTSEKRGRGRPRKSATTKTQYSTGGLDDKIVFNNTVVTNEISSNVVGNVVGGFNCVAQVEGETTMKKRRGRPRKFATMKTPDSSGVACIGVNSADGAAPVVLVTSKKRGRGRPPRFSNMRGRGRLPKFAFMKTMGRSGVAGNRVGAADGAVLVEEGTSKKRGRGRPLWFSKRRGRRWPPKSAAAAPGSIGKLDEIEHSSVGVVDGAIQVDEETTKKKGRGRPPKSVAIQTLDSIDRLDDMVVFDAHVTNEIKDSRVAGNVFGVVDGVIQVEGETTKEKGRGRPPESATSKTSESVGRLDDKVEGETTKKTPDNPDEVVVYGDVNNEICSGGVGNGVGAADGVMFVEDVTSKKRGRGRPRKSTTIKTPDSTGRLDDKVVSNADVTNEIEPSSVVGNVFGVIDGVIQVEGETTKKSRGRPPKFATIETLDSIGRFADKVVVYGDVNNEIGSSVDGNGVCASDGVVCVQDGTSKKRGRESPGVTKTQSSNDSFNEEVVVVSDTSDVFGSDFAGNGVGAACGTVQVTEEETHKKKGRGTSGAIQLEPVRTPISLQEEAEESTPTELILAFGDSCVLPSVADLDKIFGQYGPLRETETLVVQSLKIAKVVFMKRADAEVAEAALRGTREYSLFGQACIGYRLDPIGPRLSNPGGIQLLEPKRFLINLQDEECLPTELVLAFGHSCRLPSVADLVQIFGQYGPLREGETQVVENIKVARVVFKRRVDAEVAELALSSAGKYSFFQQASLEGYKLRNLEPMLQNLSLQHGP